MDSCTPVNVVSERISSGGANNLSPRRKSGVKVPQDHVPEGCKHNQLQERQKCAELITFWRCGPLRGRGFLLPYTQSLRSGLSWVAPPELD
jgi:hypothetical protein